MFQRYEIGGRFVPISPALRVCTLILLSMRLMPSSSTVAAFWFALFCDRPLIGGWDPEPRPCLVSIALGFLDPKCVCFAGDETVGGATFRLWVEKYGYNCLSKTSTRVTLSSLGSSSIGVSFNFSTLRWRSLSGCKIFGDSCRMSSRNSVKSRAARLYFYLD